MNCPNRIPLQCRFYVESMNLTDLKLNIIITYKDEPYLIISSQHQKMGRGGAVVKTKLKNLITGQTLEKTFAGGDKFSEANIKRTKASFLYNENTNYFFMDSENYEQFFLPQEILTGQEEYLKDGQIVTVLNFNNQPVTIELPIKVDLKVTQSPPAVKGDTAGTATKLITLETGKKIKAPLFVKEGDLIKVNIETGEYVERV